MRKIIMTALIASASGMVAAPATAQPWRLQAPVQRQIQGDISQLSQQIDRAAQRRTISSREASGLRQQARQLQLIYNRYSRNGLDRQEVGQLERSVNGLRVRLKLERRDWDGRRG